MTDTARKLSRREELGVESRRKIVEAAAALMAERGYAGTSIAAVSRKSGLLSGSIYWHFESKEALLAAVVEEGARAWHDALPHPDSSAEATAAMLEEHPEFLRLLLLIALERREVDHLSLAAIRRVRLRARRDLRQFVVALIEPVTDELPAELLDEFTEFFLALADGAFIAHHIDPETADVSALFRLLQQALRALAREITTPDGTERSTT
ncbi:MAG: TetR/AcrR family transcriptional regulator [Actinomycetia bacterium]|nr:TetR/AcrR family transcriptional regulator [Actinomycetes bacterium]